MRRTVISAVILVSLFWIQACDSGIDTGTDASEQLETLHLQLEEGSEFVLHLDPHLIQERRVFETLDDLHHFTDRIDDQGEVTLNKGLYLRFKHALSPSEIAALDMDGVSVVGNYRYEISEEAISKRDLTTPDAPLEVETYHGHSGKVYLEEFALIARHVGQWDKLNSSNFKDPEMRALFLQMKAGSQMKSKGKPTAPSAAPNTDQEFYGPVGTVYFNFETPDGPTTSTSYAHERGYNIWNQSVGGWSKRALAYTAVIFRPAGDYLWYGYAYGNYRQVLSSPPTPQGVQYVKARAHGGKTAVTCEGVYECQATAKRKKRRGAYSFHWGRTHHISAQGGSVYVWDMYKRSLD